MCTTGSSDWELIASTGITYSTLHPGNLQIIWNFIETKTSVTFHFKSQIEGWLNLINFKINQHHLWMVVRKTVTKIASEEGFHQILGLVFLMLYTQFFTLFHHNFSSFNKIENIFEILSPQLPSYEKSVQRIRSSSRVRIDGVRRSMIEMKKSKRVLP